MQHQLQQLTQQQQLQQQHSQSSSAGSALVRAQSVARLPAPDCFTGSPSTLDDWGADLEQQFDWYRLTTDADRLRFATGFLKGSARDWWSNLDSASRPTTWDALFAALRLRFQPVTAGETAREQLRVLSQGKGSVHTYINAFRRLLVSVPTMSDDDRLFLFLRGLRPASASFIKIQGVTRLDAAIEAAARIGGLDEHAHGIRSAASPIVSASDPFSAPMDLDAIHTETRHRDQSSRAVVPDAPITRAELLTMFDSLRRELAVDRPRDHRAPTASTGSNVHTQQRSLPRIPHLSAEQIRTYMDQGMCFGCGSTEHRSRDCPKRKIVDGRVTWSH